MDAAIVVPFFYFALGVVLLVFGCVTDVSILTIIGGTVTGICGLVTAGICYENWRKTDQVNGLQPVVVVNSPVVRPFRLHGVQVQN